MTGEEIWDLLNISIDWSALEHIWDDGELIRRVQDSLPTNADFWRSSTGESFASTLGTGAPYVQGMLAPDFGGAGNSFSIILMESRKPPPRR